MNRNEELVCGLDPGRDKCGLAVVDNQGSCLYHEIVSTVQLEEQLKQLQGKYGFSTLVMGGARARQSLPEVKLQVVDEYRTTDEAKEEYWRIYPPKGWRRLVPHGMLIPPKPVDDLAALILARRYVKAKQ